MIFTYYIISSAVSWYRLRYFVPTRLILFLKIVRVKLEYWWLRSLCCSKLGRSTPSQGHSHQDPSTTVPPESSLARYLTTYLHSIIKSIFFSLLSLPSSHSPWLKEAASSQPSSGGCTLYLYLTNPTIYKFIPRSEPAKEPLRAWGPGGEPRLSNNYPLTPLGGSLPASLEPHQVSSTTNLTFHEECRYGEQEAFNSHLLQTPWGLAAAQTSVWVDGQLSNSALGYLLPDEFQHTQEPGYIQPSDIVQIAG